MTELERLMREINLKINKEIGIIFPDITKYPSGHDMQILMSSGWNTEELKREFYLNQLNAIKRMKNKKLH